MAHVIPGICLAGPSALEYWRTVTKTPSQHEWVAESDAALRTPPSLALLGELDDRWRSTLSAPLDFVVAIRSARRVPTSLARVHLCALAMPESSIARISRGLYVVSPELALLHLADTLERFQLALVGYELCGAYAPARRGTVGLVSRNRPLTSAEGIRTTMRLMPGARNRVRVLDALELVRDGAESPMESVSAMLLGTPRRQGGLGLPSFALNHRIEFDDVARDMAHRDHARADLYWADARVDVEYEGRAYHEGEVRMASDKARANALAHMGVTTISLFDEHIQSDALFCTMAHDIARAIGFRMKPLDAKDRERRLALRRAILRHAEGTAEPQWPGLREGEPTLGEALEMHRANDGRRRRGKGASGSPKSPRGA